MSRYSATAGSLAQYSKDRLLASQRTRELREVMILATGGAVREVLPQGELAARKSQLIPWNFLLGVEADFQALGPRGESRLRQPGAEHHVHLPGVSHVDHRQQRADLDLGQGLFVAFARCRMLHGLAVFHESRGHRPKSHARFDGAAAQQNPALPL